ncbi:MAG: BatA domain-containing protein [Planctomycetales bacterium]
MSLIHPGILYGLGLAAIPIILHLLLRPKPKRLLFPALRLVQARRKTNVRRMRLRHLWLLLLRIAVLALIVLAIARPSLPAADYALDLRETLALAGIAAVAVAAYAGTIGLWGRRALPRHEFAYRRTLLRAGTGTGALLLALLLVGWPYARRVAADLSGETTVVSDELPAAAVFLFDTSLSLDYRLENRTRLEAAQEVARTHLARLPGRSRAAVLDSSRSDSLSATMFHADRSAARSRIEGLTVAPRGDPLDDAVRIAVRLQEMDRRRSLAGDEAAAQAADPRDPYHREIYVFTDLARTAWRDDAAGRLRAELDRVPWLQLYLIDVGVEGPRNVSIANVRLSQQAVSEHADVSVTAEISVQGETEIPPSVELLAMPAAGGAAVKQGHAAIKSGKQEVGFTLPRASGELVQGELRLTSTDPFPADDVGWFTVRVQPPPEVLIVAESSGEAHFWSTALKVTGAKCTESRPREVDALRPAELAKYDAVCLMNVRRPSDDLWRSLASYVEAGGGLLVFLGTDEIDESAYDGELPRTLLPGELVAPRPFRGEPAYLAFGDRNHPLLRKFQPPWGFGDLVTRPVFWCWNVTPADNAGVIARFAVEGDARLPALLERGRGKGRVLMFATAVDRRGWSELPLADWWFVALADQTVRYAAGRGTARFNYIMGEPVAVPLDADPPPERYLLREPGAEGRQVARDVPPGAAELPIDSADVARTGHYAILPAAGEAREFHSGFSVNPPPGESDFTRLAEADLDRLFGAKRYQVARDPAELESVIQQGRIGKEMYSAVLLFLLLFFGGEMLVSNRFYGVES